MCRGIIVRIPRALQNAAVGRERKGRMILESGSACVIANSKPRRTTCDGARTRQFQQAFAASNHSIRSPSSRDLPSGSAAPVVGGVPEFPEPRKERSQRLGHDLYVRYYCSSAIFVQQYSRRAMPSVIQSNTRIPCTHARRPLKSGPRPSPTCPAGPTH